jgi:hypothetical protein
MRKALTFLAVPVVFSAVAFADNWSGNLIDSSCYDRQNQTLKDADKAAEACMANDQTTSFAVHTSGKVFKLDSAGNTKAKTAISSRADRSAPGGAASKSINATVTGTESAGTIAVTEVQVK